jgi:hypothetical protein
MIIFPQQGLGFVSITKCASTTIEAGLSNQKVLFIAGTSGLKHTSYKIFEAHILPLLEAKKIPRPHFFAITREPADRLLSWYKYQQRDRIVNAKEGSSKSDKYTGNLTFEEYAEGALSIRPDKMFKFKPQRAFLVDQSQKVAVETLVRIEHVDDLLPHLFRHYRIAWPDTVERRNISPTPKGAKMTDELRKRINESDTFFADYELYRGSASTKQELLATLKPRQTRLKSIHYSVHSALGGFPPHFTKDNKMQDEATSDTVKDPKRQATKLIARTMWMQKFKESNPEADNEAIAEAWHADRAEWIKYASAGVKTMERKGLTITAIDDQ